MFIVTQIYKSLLKQEVAVDYQHKMISSPFVDVMEMTLNQSCRTRVLDLDSRQNWVRFLRTWTRTQMPRNLTWKVRTWNWNS